MTGLKHSQLNKSRTLKEVREMEAMFELNDSNSEKTIF
jgi:hypothetical protein